MVDHEDPGIRVAAAPLVQLEAVETADEVAGWAREPFLLLRVHLLMQRLHDLIERSLLAPRCDPVDVVRHQALDRIADQVDQPGVRNDLRRALGRTARVRIERVTGRGFAADREAGVEVRLVPIQASPRIGLLPGEVVELLRIRHLDQRVLAQIVVEARRSALHAADDEQVRQRAHRLHRPAWERSPGEGAKAVRLILEQVSQAK